MKNTNCKIKARDILKKNNLKITKGREELLSILISKKSPFSVEKIESLFSKKIDKSTIYRILEKFVEKKIVYQTDFRKNKAYFEYQDNHHHHIICTSCNKKESVDICIKDKVEDVLKKSVKFKKINTHTLEFFSTCNKCAK